MHLSRHGWMIPALVVLLWVGSSPLFGLEPGGEEGQPPVITSSLQGTAEAGGQWNYQILASGAPDLFGAEVMATGVTLQSVNDQTGEIVANIAPDFTGGSFFMTIFAENAHGRDERTVEVAVTTGGGEEGQPPVITSSLQDTAVAGMQWNYQILASDAPDLFGAEVTATGVTLQSVNDQTGEIVANIAPNFTGGSFFMTIFAENAHGRDEQAVEVAVTTGEEDQPPVIDSPLEIEAFAGEELVYEITASGTVTLFGATVNAPGVILQSFDDQTGEIRVSIAPGFSGETFVMAISAENEFGKDEQAVTVAVINDGGGEIGEPGPAQVMEASISVREPAVDKANLMLYSSFSFRGKVRTQGDEQEGSGPGSFFAPITESRVTNGDILQRMKESELIESVDGFKLAMESSLGDETATLVAVKKKKRTNPEEEDVIVPVPEDILAVRFGEDEQRITGYAGKTIEEEPVITRLAGYEAVEVDWLKSYGSTEHVRLTGIGRFAAKRKSVVIEGEKEFYYSYSRSASVAGFNSGAPLEE